MRCRLRVAPPEEQHLRMLGHVAIKVGGRHHLPHRLAAPHVLGPPVLALPAVQVAHLDGVAAEKGEKPVGAAVTGAEMLGLAVHVRLGEHGFGTVRRAHSLQLGSHQLRRLVPRDAHVAALAPVLRVPFAVRIPIDPLERIADSILRIDALLVGEPDRPHRRPHRRLERLALRLELPGVEVLRVVAHVVVKGPDPRDPAVLHVDERGRTGVAPTDEAGASDDLLIRPPSHL